MSQANLKKNSSRQEETSDNAPICWEIIQGGKEFNVINIQNFSKLRRWAKLWKLIA